MRKIKKKRERRNRLIFGACTVISGAAAMLGINALPVMASEDVGEEMAVGKNVGAGISADTDDGTCTAGKLSENSQMGVIAENEDLGVYDFKDNKTTGTVTVTKEWSDKRTNSERPEPEIKISTKKPSKSTLGYTVTFHGNKDTGLVFDDGSDVNEVVYNSSGQIVDGAFKMPGGFSAKAVSWFTDKALTNKVDVNEDGVIQMALTGDVDLWVKTKTFKVKGYKYDAKNANGFNAVIPDTVTEIIFTNETKPASAAVIDVDADGDGGVVAWIENGGTVMKVSTQIKGMKVQAAKNSGSMFYNRSKLTNIDFSMLDTQNVTNMESMFNGCSGLTSLNLTPLNTANATSMESMFKGCSGLTSLDLTSFNTANVTNMVNMFTGCSGLTSLDLTSFNTAKVTSMESMFYGCSGLTSLDLTPFNTAKVTNMGYMFYGCSGLTSLDLTPLNTAKVQSMKYMFFGCSGLTSLDLTPLNTANVRYMEAMFYGCSGLTSLDLTLLNTANVKYMSRMFYGCSGLTNLDLTSFNTVNVTNMEYMFFGCSGLTILDLTPLNTANVRYMKYMFGCSGLTTLKTGATFKFAGTNYNLFGTWRNTAGETFTSGSFPSNVADTYTKVS